VCVCIFIDAGHLLPNELPNDSSPEYRFTMTGYKDGRDRLVSGVYQARGIYTEIDPIYGELRGEVHIYCSFDEGRKVMRFDRRQPYREIVGKANPDAKGDHNGSKVSNRLTQYILKEDGIVYYYVDGSSVVSATFATKSPHIEAPFKIKSVGLLYWNDYSRGVEFDRLYSAISARKPTQVVDETPQVTRINWDSESSKTRQTIWFDKTAGFGIVRMQMQHRKKEPTGAVFFSEPQTTSEISWQQVNNVWVPKTFRLQTEEQVGAPRSIELAFEWASVNKPIPSEDLTVENFRISKEARFIDYTGKQPVVIDILAANPDIEVHKSFARNAWLPWAAITALLGVGLYLSFRYVRRNRVSKSPTN
jgi:hypothetical protein